MEHLINIDEEDMSFGSLTNIQALKRTRLLDVIDQSR